MRVAFFGRLFPAAGPAFQQQWPERHRSGNDEQAESPRALRGVRIDSFHPNEHERNGEYQPARQVSSKRNQKEGRDHTSGVKGRLSRPSVRWTFEAVFGQK